MQSAYLILAICCCTGWCWKWSGHWWWRQKDGEGWRQHAGWYMGVCFWQIDAEYSVCGCMQHEVTGGDGAELPTIEWHSCLLLWLLKEWWYGQGWQHCDNICWVLWLSKGRKDGLIVPLSCRQPFGLAFVLGVSLDGSCWTVTSPSLAATIPGPVAFDKMLPLLRTTESLTLLIAMLQVLDGYAILLKKQIKQSLQSCGVFRCSEIALD